MRLAGLTGGLVLGPLPRTSLEGLVGKPLSGLGFPTGIRLLVFILLGLVTDTGGGRSATTSGGWEGKTGGDTATTVDSSFSAKGGGGGGGGSADLSR